MKKHLTLFFLIALCSAVNAQSISTYPLSFNNVDASVNDGGVFFNEHNNFFPSYEVPSGSGLHLFYSMGFWFGGVDVNNQLKLSAQRYDNLSDQFKGPLTADGSAMPDNSSWLSSLFPITKAEIDQHIANYMNAGYVPPGNILNWPAHGDVTLGFDYYLAPFVDTDGDGNYNPMAGDYPCIRGDQAIYVIMNDKGGVHASGGDQIGIEMHYMFYEYVGIPEIQNTTFVNMKLINRGTQTLNEFKVSTFLDGDIGYFGDDYIGSDISRNMLFFYNGDNLDESGGGSSGYSSGPPAAGIISLNNDVESIGIADATDVASEFWFNMNAQDVSGMNWMDPTTSSPTNFMYSADPGNVSQTNSEVAQANPPGDRRGVANINIGTLEPFSEHTFDYAVIYNRDFLNNIENATALKNTADVVQDFYDTSFVDDCIVNQSTIGLDESELIDFSIYPNPSDGQFNIALMNDFSNAEFELQDLSGRAVTERMKLTSKETNIEVNQRGGVYLLHLMVDGRESTKRIVLK